MNESLPALHSLGVMSALMVVLSLVERVHGQPAADDSPRSACSARPAGFAICREDPPHLCARADLVRG